MSQIVKWEEIIAEARSAGILAFCADGVAVLKRADDAAKEKTGSSVTLAGEDREQGRQGGQGKSESANQGAS